MGWDGMGWGGVGWGGCYLENRRLVSLPVAANQTRALVEDCHIAAGQAAGHPLPSRAQRYAAYTVRDLSAQMLPHARALTRAHVQPT
jgi:hypothetical protein